MLHLDRVNAVEAARSAYAYLPYQPYPARGSDNQEPAAKNFQDVLEETKAQVPVVHPDDSSQTGDAPSSTGLITSTCTLADGTLLVEQKYPDGRVVASQRIHLKTSWDSQPDSVDTVSQAYTRTNTADTHTGLLFHAAV